MRFLAGARCCCGPALPAFRERLGRPCHEPVRACSPLAARHSLYFSKPNLSCVPAHGQRPCLCAAQPSRAALPQCQDDDAELKPLPGAMTTSTATSTRKLNMSLQHTDTPQPQTQVRHDQAWNTPRPRPNRQTVPSSPMSRRKLAVASHRERTIGLAKPTCGTTAALPRAFAAGGHVTNRPCRAPCACMLPEDVMIATVLARPGHEPSRRGPVVAGHHERKPAQPFFFHK